MIEPVRVYVPLTLEDVRRALESGSLRPRGGLVFAVTAELRAEYREATDEELEFLAMSDAARACLRLIGENGPWLRVVAAADAVGLNSASDRDRAAAVVVGAIELSQVAAFHLDGAEASAAVRAAAGAVHAADLGDLDAEFIVGSAEDHALAWYAPSEMRYLLQEIDPSH